MAYLEALKISQEIGDRQGEGVTLNNISQISSSQKELTTKRWLTWKRRLKFRQEIGDRQGEGVTLNNISQIHKVKGAYDEALAYLEASLKIQSGNRRPSGRGSDPE